jgi:hypothetical protein
MFLSSLEQGLGFVEEELGAAGFAEELEGAAGAGDVLLDLYSIAGIGGQHEELAVGHLEVKRLRELEAVLLGHGDVAKQQAGDEGPGACEAIGCGVNGFAFVAVGLKDEIESVGYKMVIVDDQNTLFHETPRALPHGGNLVWFRVKKRDTDGITRRQ